LAPNTDAADVRYFKFTEIPVTELAFDHKKILKDAFNLMDINYLS